MVARTLPNLALKGFYDLGEDGWKADMDLNLLKLSMLTQGGVIAKLAADPATPADGDIYVFDATHPTQPNKVAIRDAGAWVYVTPAEGWLLYNRTLNYYEKFDGAAWAQLQTGGVPEAPVDTKLYGRKDAAWAEIVGGGGGGAGDIVLLEERVVATAAQADFIGLINATYRNYIVEITNYVPSVEAELRMQYTSDGGATFDATAIYDTAIYQSNEGTFASTVSGGGNLGHQRLFWTVPPSSDAAASGRFVLFNPSNPNSFKAITGQTFSAASDAAVYNRQIGGRYRNNAAVNGFRLLPSAGTFSAIVRVYGERQVTASAGAASAAGVAFPAGPAVNQRFYRTDRKIEYAYDGVRWLSTQLLSLTAPTNGAASGTHYIFLPIPYQGSHSVWLERLDATFNRATAGEWDIVVRSRTAADIETDIIILDGAGDPNATWVSRSGNIGAVLDVNARIILVILAPVSGTSTFYGTAVLHYRLVG